MARPKKDGLDYFPHDTDSVNDEKIESLRLLYGNDGYAFYFILLERIYRAKDAELDVSDAETIQILSKKVSISTETFYNILETCFKRGCFDREEYENRGVLTSDGIKKRSAPVIKKRETMRDKSNGQVSDAETKKKPTKEKESREDNSKEKQKEDTIREIKDLRSSFSQELINLVDTYWTVIKKTRKTNTVSYSVILKTMRQWSKYEQVVIKYSLKKHIESYDDGERNEKYTIGIMRNTTPDEAEDLLNKNVMPFKPKSKGAPNYEESERSGGWGSELPAHVKLYK